MNSKIVLTMCYRICRSFHTSNITYKVPSLVKQGNFMNKIIRKSRTKKSWYQNTNELELFNQSRSKEKYVPSGHVSRRMAVLNKLFMQHITSLMATGEASFELLNRNIEVLYVRVPPDFSCVNVYWTDSLNNNENKISNDEMLSKCALHLRNELSQLRVMSVVPPINFVRDKLAERMKEVDRRLQMADFGPDYEPSSAAQISNPRELNLEAFEYMNYKELYDSKDQENERSYTMVPTMGHTIFGLNHARIMTKIKKSMSQHKSDLKYNLSNTEDSDSSDPPKYVTNFSMEENQQKTFSEFLAKRKREEKWKYKLQKRQRDVLDIDSDNDEDNIGEDDTFDDIYDKNYDFEDEYINGQDDIDRK